ncbi:unnamed protein product, partial [Urochloa humidicola]
RRPRRARPEREGSDRVGHHRQSLSRARPRFPTTMAKAAMEAAAKGMISLSRARAAAASAAARTSPRWIHSTGGEVGGAGAASGAKAGRTVTRGIYSTTDKRL